MSIDISVIVSFYRMDREAPRTLYSVSKHYQRDCLDISYEIIGIDNGSPSGPPKDIPVEIRPVYTSLSCSGGLSPVSGLNYAARQARGRILLILIDGARLLSPGILSLTRTAFRAFDNPFVFTMGMHLGPEIQNTSILKGYNQSVEDRVLETIDWKDNGYRLFEVSCPGLSSRGFFEPMSESNCFGLLKTTFLDAGGFDERFQSPGGGLANLEFFNRMQSKPGTQPVMLLGESTFHQIHGGVASNALLADHPWPRFLHEYEQIFGQAFTSIWRTPIYLGTVHEAARRLLSPQRL